MNTWNRLLADAAGSDVIIAKAPADEAIWDEEFDSGEGPKVLAWSETRVYFPVIYDGAEWVESAPRDPRLNGQAHVGGG